jgi:hypothetical protein
MIAAFEAADHERKGWRDRYPTPDELMRSLASEGVLALPTEDRDHLDRAASDSRRITMHDRNGDPAPRRAREDAQADPGRELRGLKHVLSYLASQYHLPRANPPKAISPTKAMISPIQKLQTKIRTIPTITMMPPTDMPAIPPRSPGPATRFPSVSASLKRTPPTVAAHLHATGGRDWQLPPPPHGFEGSLRVAVEPQPKRHAPTKGPDHRRLAVDLNATPPSSAFGSQQGDDDVSLVTQFFRFPDVALPDVLNLRVELPDSVVPLVDSGIENPIRHVELELRVTEGHQLIEVAGVQRLVSTPHYLHVLPHHRLPSIPRPHGFPPRTRPGKLKLLGRLGGFSRQMRKIAAESC